MPSLALSGRDLSAVVAYSRPWTNADSDSLANTDALRVPVIARPADDPSIAPRLERIWETRPA